MNLLIIIFLLTILTGKNCVLLSVIQEFSKIEAWLRHTFSYVDKISSVKE